MDNDEILGEEFDEKKLPKDMHIDDGDDADFSDEENDVVDDSDDDEEDEY
jgi:hypothetical protein